MSDYLPANAREASWINLLNLRHLGTGTVLGDWQRGLLDAIMALADTEHAALTADIERLKAKVLSDGRVIVKLCETQRRNRAEIAERDAEIAEMLRDALEEPT